MLLLPPGSASAWMEHDVWIATDLSDGAEWECPRARETCHMLVTYVIHVAPVNYQLTEIAVCLVIYSQSYRYQRSATIRLPERNSLYTIRYSNITNSAHLIHLSEVRYISVFITLNYNLGLTVKALHENFSAVLLDEK